MPIISSTVSPGACGAGGAWCSGEGLTRRAPRSPLLSRGRDLPVDDLLLEVVDLVDDVLGNLGRDLPDGDAAVGEVEDRVLAALEGAVRDGLDGVEDRGVHPLHRAGEDVRSEVGLVAVHADPPDALVGRRVERPEAA